MQLLMFCLKRRKVFISLNDASKMFHAHLFHGYNTGSRDLLSPPFAKTTKYQGSFRINGARTYNTLPRIIRQVETLNEFKIKLKRHFKQ